MVVWLSKYNILLLKTVYYMISTSKSTSDIEYSQIDKSKSWDNIKYIISKKLIVDLLFIKPNLSILEIINKKNYWGFQQGILGLNL